VLRVTWRNLLARKLRLLLSAFAIVLGVAFVAGSLVFTDTIDRAFDDIVGVSVSDVTVRFEGAVADEETGAVQPDTRSIPAALVDELSEQPGVARADGTV